MRSLLIEGIVRLFQSTFEDLYSLGFESSSSTGCHLEFCANAGRSSLPSAIRQGLPSRPLAAKSSNLSGGGLGGWSCSELSGLEGTVRGSGGSVPRSSSSSGSAVSYRAHTRWSEQEMSPSENRQKREQGLEQTITSLLSRFCQKQVVVIGKLPAPLPRATIYVVSRDEYVPPYCWHVPCRQDPTEWSTALVLMGFDWRQSTVWLLRLPSASDAMLLEQLMTVAKLRAPCIVVLLFCWSSLVIEVADAAGFSVDKGHSSTPLYVLKREKRYDWYYETDSSYTSPLYSLPPEPEVDVWVVQFALFRDGTPLGGSHMVSKGCAKVVGNCKELGLWDVRHGVQLEEVGEHWVAEVVFEKVESVQYKYVLEGNDGLVEWEFGNNRCLTNENNNPAHLVERWRDCKKLF